MKNLHIHLLSYFLMISGCSDIHKNPYNADNVYIDIKNEKPCFYINYKKLKGGYDIVIKDQDSDDYWDYKDTFERSYPNKENCVLFNEDSFRNSKKLDSNRKYNVTLSSLTSGFGNEFCLRKGDEKIIIQKIVKNKCEDIQETEEDKLIYFFKKIFYTIF